MIYSLRVFGCCITNTRPRVPGWEGWADMCASCVHYSCIPEFKGKRQRGTVSVLSTLCRYKTAIMSICPDTCTASARTEVYLAHAMLH